MLPQLLCLMEPLAGPADPDLLEHSRQIAALVAKGQCGDDGFAFAGLQLHGQAQHGGVAAAG